MFLMLFSRICTRYEALRKKSGKGAKKTFGQKLKISILEVSIGYIHLYTYFNYHIFWLEKWMDKKYNYKLTA